LYPIVILNCDENGKTFLKKPVFVENDGFLSVNIPPKRKQIKKLLEKNSDKTFLLGSGLEKEEVYSKCFNGFNHISYDCIKSILVKLCKEVAVKYSLAFPLDEIYIFAPPDISYELVCLLMDISRLFTVVSHDYDTKKADELYFKYGCILRQKEIPDERDHGDKITIYADESVNYIPGRAPFVNLTRKKFDSLNTININEIKVCDEKILPISATWGGTTGLSFYTFLGLIPDESATVDLSKKANEIFVANK